MPKSKKGTKRSLDTGQLQTRSRLKWSADEDNHNPFALNQAGSSVTEDTVPSIVEDLAGSVIAVLIQFGGHSGSEAGDAAMFSIEGSRRIFLVDGGSSKRQKVKAANAFAHAKGLKDEAADSGSYESDAEDDLGGQDDTRAAMNTHAHEDHTFNLDVLKQLSRIFVGESQDVQIENVSKLNKHEVKSGEVLLRWKSRRPLTEFGKKINQEMTFQFTAIKPDPIKPDLELSNIKMKSKKTNANELSLGYLFTVNIGTERVFTFYSLGDMTPRGKIALVNVFKDEETGKNIHPDLVKLPHHGSINNIELLPDIDDKLLPGGFIGEKTTVIASGWTNSAPDQLLKRWRKKGIDLKKNAEQQVRILFDSIENDTRGAFGSDKTGAIADISQSFAVKNLMSVGVKFANNLNIVFNSEKSKPFEIKFEVTENLTELKQKLTRAKFNNINTAFEPTNKNKQVSNVTNVNTALEPLLQKRQAGNINNIDYLNMEE